LLDADRHALRSSLVSQKRAPHKAASSGVNCQTTLVVTVGSVEPTARGV